MAAGELSAWVEGAVSESGSAPVLMLGTFAPHLKGDNITRIERPEPRSPLPGGGRQFHLAVAVGLLEKMEGEQASALLAALRDLSARRLLVAISIAGSAEPGSGKWTREDMLAYGMESLGLARHEGETFAMYGFDIDRYKRTPDWLNARHWANPENWGRFRW